MDIRYFLYNTLKKRPKFLFPWILDLWTKEAQLFYRLSLLHQLIFHSKWKPCWGSSEGQLPGYPNLSTQGAHRVCLPLKQQIPPRETTNWTLNELLPSAALRMIIHLPAVKKHPQAPVLNTRKTSVFSEGTTNSWPFEPQGYQTNRVVGHDPESSKYALWILTFKTPS